MLKQYGLAPEVLSLFHPESVLSQIETFLKPEPTLLLPDEDTLASTGSSVEEEVLTDATAQEMSERAGLAERQRQVFELVFVKEMPRDEAARSLNVTRSTLDNTVAAIKRKIASLYNLSP